ncbi:unnamed protein product [Arabidopsis halleri]
MTLGLSEYCVFHDGGVCEPKSGGWSYDDASSVIPIIQEWSNRVKILHIWQSFDGVCNSLNLILVDDDETKIHAAIEEYLVARFSSKLVENRWIIIKKFMMTPSYELFRPTPHRFKVQFCPDTEIIMDPCLRNNEEVQQWFAIQRSPADIVLDGTQTE